MHGETMKYQDNLHTNNSRNI